MYATRRLPGIILAAAEKRTRVVISSVSANENSMTYRAIVVRNGPEKEFFSSLLGILLLLLGMSAGQSVELPANSEAAISEVKMFDEVLPACSPDGRWLAFEYHEAGAPIYPHIGIADLKERSRTLRPLLEERPASHLYAGDFSWSPDSHWVALVTDYPSGRKSFWADTSIQIVKVNIYTHEVVTLSDFPVNTHFGPTIAWLRSGLVVFSGADENIYAMPETGRKPRKLISVPTDQCLGGTNTLAVSPNGRRIAFAMDAGSEEQTEKCNALWIGELNTGRVTRVPTPNLHPLSPNWLDDDTILFSGESDDEPVGIYRVSLTSEKVVLLLKGQFMTPFVCASTRDLCFSWRAAQTQLDKASEGHNWPLYGYHIWKVPLRDVLR
jgi:WD40-like Beta Propeller Repeat